MKQRQSEKTTFSIFKLLEYQKIRFKDASRYHWLKTILCLIFFSHLLCMCVSAMCMCVYGSSFVSLKCLRKICFFHSLSKFVLSHFQNILLESKFKRLPYTYSWPIQFSLWYSSSFCRWAWQTATPIGFGEEKEQEKKKLMSKLHLSFIVWVSLFFLCIWV